MPELLKYSYSECYSFFNSIDESFSSILLDVYSELFTDICDVIRGTKYV